MLKADNDLFSMFWNSIKVVISEKMIKSVRNSRTRYEQYMEEARAKEAATNKVNLKRKQIEAEIKALEEKKKKIEVNVVRDKDSLDFQIAALRNDLK